MSYGKNFLNASLVFSITIGLFATDSPKFKCDPNNALPVVNSREMAKSYSLNIARFKRDYFGKKIRMQGRIEIIGDGYIKFYPGNYLWFKVNNLKNGLMELNEKDMVEVVCTLNGTEPSDTATVWTFAGVEVHKTQ